MKFNFNDHSRLEGSHAFLGASKYHWINYDEDKLINTYKRQLAAQQGTRFHAFAAECISLGQRLPKSKKTLNSYVNDAIGFRMTPEQILYYSENCYGTADAISFRNNTLRIHDYKSGEVPAHIEQLYIYAALFCLEYNVAPGSIEHIELRIYQNDDIFGVSTETEENLVDDIAHIMDKIIVFDKAINKIKQEEA